MAGPLDRNDDKLIEKIMTGGTQPLVFLIKEIVL